MKPRLYSGYRKCSPKEADNLGIIPVSDDEMAPFEEPIYCSRKSLVISWQPLDGVLIKVKDRSRRRRHPDSLILDRARTEHGLPLF